MFDRVEFNESSLTAKGRVAGQVIASLGDEQRCRDLLAATLETLRPAIAEWDRTLKPGRRASTEVIVRRDAWRTSWNGMPRLYEEIYWGDEAIVQYRRTPSIEIVPRIRVGKFVRRKWSIKFVKRVWFHAHLTVDLNGTVYLGPVPATPNSFREWISWGEAAVMSPYRIPRYELTEEDRDRLFPDSNEGVPEASEFFRMRPMFASGNEQRCESLLISAVNNLQAAIAECKDMVGSWRASLEIARPKTMQRKDGLLRNWDGDPCLYEEFYRVRHSFERCTPGFEVAVNPSTSYGPRKAKTTLTVSIDGTVQLGSVPATPDSLRQWIFQCLPKSNRSVGTGVSRVDSDIRRNPDYHRFERWLTRAPLISQSDLRAPRANEFHETHGEYAGDEPMKDIWEKGIAALAERLAVKSIHVNPALIGGRIPWDRNSGGNPKLDNYKNGDSFNLPYKDALYVCVHEDKHGQEFHNWIGSIWRKNDEETIIVRWTAHSKGDYLR